MMIKGYSSDDNWELVLMTIGVVQTIKGYKSDDHFGFKL